MPEGVVIDVRNPDTRAVLEKERDQVALMLRNSVGVQPYDSILGSAVNLTATATATATATVTVTVAAAAWRRAMAAVKGITRAALAAAKVSVGRTSSVV
jgi:hypothetical protein